jgi:hypothetical protein
MGKVSDAFDGIKISKKRQPVIDILTDRAGRWVNQDELSEAVYGEKNGAIVMVMKGVEFIIKKESLPVELRKQKSPDNGTQWGLWAA